LLWVAAAAASDERRALAVLVHRGRAPEPYGGAWAQLRLTRGCVLGWQLAFKREVVALALPSSSLLWNVKVSSTRAPRCGRS